MIRHVVLFEVKPEISSTELNSIFEELMLWKTTIKGILSIACGKCNYHKNKKIKTFTHGFSIDFKDELSFKNFFDDRETHSVKDKLINIVVNGYDGIFGFEFEKFE